MFVYRSENSLVWEWKYFVCFSDFVFYTSNYSTNCDYMYIHWCRSLLTTDIDMQGSLRNYLRKKDVGLSDDIDRMRCYTVQILEGVCYLHHQEPVILHRDIKGSNVLMNSTLTCIKLADFGCAKEVLQVSLTFEQI